MNWPAWRQDAAHEDMLALKAMEQLEDPDRSGGMTPDQLYDLVLAATRSEAKARAAARARLRRRMAEA